MQLNHENGPSPKALITDTSPDTVASGLSATFEAFDANKTEIAGPNKYLRLDSGLKSNSRLRLGAEVLILLLGLIIIPFLSTEARITIKSAGREFVSGAGSGFDVSVENVRFLFASSREFFSLGTREGINSVSSALSEATQIIESRSSMFAQGYNIATISAVSDPLVERASVYSVFKYFSSQIIRLAYVGYYSVINPIRNFANPIWKALASTGVNSVDSIMVAWGTFISRLGADRESEAELRDRIRTEILAEENNNNNVSVSETNESKMFGQTGIVVLKGSGSTTLDLSKIKKLNDAFSDRVLVKFNEEGTSGTIEPIFRNSLGEKYLFVITPIKQ